MRVNPGQSASLFPQQWQWRDCRAKEVQTEEALVVCIPHAVRRRWARFVATRCFYLRGQAAYLLCAIVLQLSSVWSLAGSARAKGAWP